MQRTLTTLFTLACCLTLAAQEERSLVHFASGSAALDATARAQLRQICELTGGRVPGSITITGHTDDVGSDAYNRDLSERRAEAVRRALQNSCPALAATQIAWKGEAAPVASNTSDGGRASNRRVEVVLCFDPPTPTIDVVTEMHCGIERDVELHRHPRVTPLFPAADKPREHFSPNADAPIDLTAADGTRILIPANALVDDEGRPLTGAVDITFRSFLEPYEILASGIPMHVHTDAGEEHLETAGMYEIYASQRGKQVQLAPGERITVLAANNAAADSAYTGWVLDPSSGTWQAGGSLDQLASTARTASLPMTPLGTAATRAYWDQLARLGPITLPDTTLFDARRASGDYCHLTPCDTTTPVKVGWRQRRERFATTAGVPEITLAGFKGSLAHEEVTFTVQIGKDMQFPEWRRLPGGIVWRYAGTEDRATFKRLFGRRHAFQDIMLVMGPGQDQGVLRLKENGEWLDLPVDLSIERNTTARAERWDRSLRNYEKTLNKQRFAFDRDITHNKVHYWKRYKNDTLQAWHKAQPYMSQEERAMACKEWAAYALPSRPRPIEWHEVSAKAGKAMDQMQTRFSLDGFGIYNIDRLFHMCNTRNVIVNATDGAGRSFPWTFAYGVLENERSVITYYGSGTGVQDHLLVAPGRMRSLFLVDNEGHIVQAPVTALNEGPAQATLVVGPMEPGTDLNTLRATASN